MMKATTYFAILRNTFERICKDLDRLNEMKERATSCGSFKYSDDPAVQRSMSEDKISKAVTEYVDFSNRLSDRIQKYQERRCQVINQISQLPDPLQRQVLMKVYVEFKTVQQTAAECERSESHLWTVKRNALKAFERQWLT